MTARILVVGSANVDFTVAAPRLPVPGETVTDGTLLVNHGGKGANQAVAARRLGADVRLIACVGSDPSGAGMRAALAREGVAIDGVVDTTAAATGTALIVVDPAGRNQITVAPGANRALTVDAVRARAGDFAWAQVVVTQLEIPLDCVAATLTLAREHGAITVLNPAPVPAARLEVFSLVDYLTPNAGEVERLSGIAVRTPEDVPRAARVLRDAGAGTVIVTLGEDGACAYGAAVHGAYGASAHQAGAHDDGAETARVPAFVVRAIDTTAAGDAFNAGLAVALAEGRALHDALRFASATAALTCTRRGAQASLPVRAEVERLLQQPSPRSRQQP